ncbi:MAG TPA: hypothetical protein VF167_05610 [Longimicrobiaceae bacterium]
MSYPPADDDARRREVLERLAAAARRLGLPRERLALLLRKLEANEEATRSFLAREVYGVTEEELDEMLRRELGEGGD